MTTLPHTVADIWDVPASLRRLYEEQRDAYRLTPAGRELVKAREAARDPRNAPQNDHGSVEVELSDWSFALAVASPEERKLLLQKSGRGQIKVTR